jgi:hypothetical protein
VITNGQVVKAVVDTGAEVTVMSEATYFCIPEERRPCLCKAKRKLVVAEAGRKITTSGGQYEKHHVMIPLLINQSNISRDFSLHCRNV